MPYKNSEVQKEYQHQWYLRKRDKLPTKTKPILSKEEKQKRKLEFKRKQNSKIRKRNRETIADSLGKVCYFCDYGKRLIVHRKDNTEHKQFSSLSKSELKHELEINKDKYVRVCYKCHKSIHWCMTILHMNWNDLISFKDPFR
jgi:hypothetical protein